MRVKCESSPERAVGRSATPRLTLDGTEYEIGLNAEHHRALRDALARRHWATMRVIQGAHFITK
jgi:hypothetical protein